jgi:hypothetical protein
MTEECSMCSMHKAFHDVAVSEKRMVQFQLMDLKLELEKANATIERMRQALDSSLIEKGNK